MYLGRVCPSRPSLLPAHLLVHLGTPGLVALVSLVGSDSVVPQWPSLAQSACLMSLALPVPFARLALVARDCEGSLG